MLFSRAHCLNCFSFIWIRCFIVLYFFLFYCSAHIPMLMQFSLFPKFGEWSPFPSKKYCRWGRIVWKIDMPPTVKFVGEALLMHLLFTVTDGHLGMWRMLQSIIWEPNFTLLFQVPLQLHLLFIVKNVWARPLTIWTREAICNSKSEIVPLGHTSSESNFGSFI